MDLTTDVRRLPRRGSVRADPSRRGIYINGRKPNARFPSSGFLLPARRVGIRLYPVPVGVGAVRAQWGGGAVGRS
eukprot:7223474-Prymnesium_polylepis.1